MIWLPNLSLVIPTYNRQRFALRSMRFWSGYGVTVHVVDGSHEAVSPNQLGDLPENIRYHHLPVPLTERLGYATELVHTEYVALMSDDEFFVPSALGACVAELVSDRAKVSCIGRCLRFQVAGQQVRARPAYENMRDYSVTDSRGIERMVFHMNPYRVSSCYSVMRRHVWSRVMSLVAEREFEDPAISELQIELATAYFGQSRVIDQLMWLRSSENDSLWPRTGYRTIVDWWQDDAEAPQRSGLVRLTAAHLAVGSDDSRADLEAGVELALGAYVNGYWSTRQRVRPVPLVRRALQRSSEWFPKELKSRAKKVFERSSFLGSFSDPEPKPLREAAAELRSTGVVVDFAQLALIERAILSTYIEAPDVRSLRSEQ